jgi:hypothetical protein
MAALYRARHKQASILVAEPAAKELRELGHFVFSPHENDARYGVDPTKPVSPEMRKKLIRDDLDFICTACDEVWVFPNWRGQQRCSCGSRYGESGGGERGLYAPR